MSDTKKASVDIGFLEKKENWLLHPRFFPSKVGGVPAWLDLRDLPLPNELVCSGCQDPLVFLCQVYAPYENKDECFHRTLFIFICKNGNCCHQNSSDNFVVLRCQLPRDNEFYSNEPAEDNDNEEFCLKKWSKLCAVCGGKAPSHCSKCKQVYYCGRKHQIYDWQKGHKQACGKEDYKTGGINKEFTISEAGRSILFEEWELIVDEEDEDEKASVDVKSEMEKMQKLLNEKSVTLNNVDENEMEQYVGPSPEDKVFNKFNKRIARHPDQVLRYERGGAPLWITDIAEERLEVPKCPYCNENRQFEFQIMPQLLNFINVGLDINSIDWGVLAVYTCSASCSSEPAYKKEYLIKQDLTNVKNAKK